MIFAYAQGDHHTTNDCEGVAYRGNRARGESYDDLLPGHDEP